MHTVFQKALANGATAVHFDYDWSALKYKMTQTEGFGAADWDAHNFSWEQLRNGDIINDGVSLWRYIDLEFADSGIEIFEGRVIFLIEIDPVF